MKTCVFTLLITGLATLFMLGCERSVTKTVTSVETNIQQHAIDFTIDFVDAAVEKYKTEGYDATISYYNDIESVEGQWYVAILDINGIIIANAFQPDAIGKNASDIGNEIVWMKISEASKKGEWVSYEWTNFETGETELKHSWVVHHNSYIFLSGYYESS